MEIPLVDLKEQFKLIQKEVEEAVADVLKSGIYILGPNVEALEKEVSSYCGTSYAVGVASGTDALRISLLASGIGKDDEVITTPFTFIATIQAIMQVGATPVFVDIEEDTFNIDVDKIEKAITAKTRAILPVHLFGHTVNMQRLLSIARKYNLFVIEDAAQSFGSECNIASDTFSPEWKKAGSMGDAGCFSFFPTKNLGGFGDGGMVITDNREVAEKAKALRVHGGNSNSYSYEISGYNSRLDELQAIILRIKLKYVEKWTEMRKEKAFLYNKLLFATPVKIPNSKPYARHSFCVYTIRISAALRDKLKDFLKSYGINTKIYYPIPANLQVMYRNLTSGKGKYSLPVAKKACQEVLSLPVYPELEEGKIIYIAEKIVNFFNRKC
ncbi:DegT/DnrJ/EryC1/StrS family aminotransferase [Candidatus Aerophobetes bacterium]|nr:DegT/DnrJ/EryC1/StrS family aminotransferase [Candidatus Aerophobetes bacterium]